ncbi:hypothetical protein ABZW96_30055 [Nocardia sp. NPDC004168]|uniref:hypothetical protein n=1 Tax=Nocardia TaxID=1817 RepID=UPI0033BEE6FD
MGLRAAEFSPMGRHPQRCRSPGAPKPRSSGGSATIYEGRRTRIGMTGGREPGDTGSVAEVLA